VSGVVVVVLDGAVAVSATLVVVDDERR